jgi:hypothetical protein
MKKRINSRDKGKRGELELAAYLRDAGYAGAKRGQQFKGSPDSPDVAGLPGHHVECKRVEALQLYPALAQACRDASAVSIPLVVHRKNDQEWVAILKLDDYLSLVQERDRLLRQLELSGSDF